MKYPIEVDPAILGDEWEPVAIKVPRGSLVTIRFGEATVDGCQLILRRKFKLPAVLVEHCPGWWVTIDQDGELKICDGEPYHYSDGLWFPPKGCCAYLLPPQFWPESERPKDDWRECKWRIPG